MKLQFPFVQLPITFDAAALADEVLAVDEKCWRDRAVGATGNSALTLVTTDGDPDSDELAGPMRPTPWLERCPYVMQVLDALGAPWGRSRLMRLSGRSQVAAHVDTNYYWRERMRVHIPIITTPAVRFQCGEAEVNMAAGECWIFDTWRRHRVLNESDSERIHLVADTVGGDRLWDLIASGRPLGAPQREWLPKHVAPQPAIAAPELDFETVNVPTVMSPWEMRAHIVFLLNETVQSVHLPAIHQLLGRFSRGWQALWSCYGESREGWPRYRALLDATQQELVTCGANQVALRNETGLMQVLDAYVFAVALNDHEATTSDARKDTHGESPLTSGSGGPAMVRARNPGADPMFDRPVFIVSPPRSGSTLLFEALSGAVDVFTIGDESHALIEGVATLSPPERGYDSNRLLADDASNAVVAQLRQRFHESLRDRDGLRREGTAAVRMLEKTPKNALRIPFLREVFPEARFIYLHRDPRQVLASMIDGWQSGHFRMYSQLPGWTGLPWSFLLIPGWRELIGQSLDEIVGRQWECATRILLDDLARLPPDHWITADYGRFLADPQAEIIRLCEWSKMGWDRSLGRELPLSRYTISKPDPEKWRRHATVIEVQLEKMRPLADRAALAAAG